MVLPVKGFNVLFVGKEIRYVNVYGQQTMRYTGH